MNVSSPLVRLCACGLIIALATACTAPVPKYTAITAAYPGEMNAIIEGLDESEVAQKQRINGTLFITGKVNGHPVVIFETGIGLTNAAMTTQLALERFDIGRLLFAGVAGGLDPGLTKGDVAIPASWHYYEYGARFSPDPSNPNHYHIPSFMKERVSEAHHGNFFPYAMRVTRAGETETALVSMFPMDEQLLAVAKATATKTELMNAAGKPAKVSVGGVGGSGLAFNDDRDFSAFVVESWGTGTVDMESAAIAHVCWTNRLPCLQIRSVSDLVGNENPNEFEEFRGFAEHNAGKLVVAILRGSELPLIRGE